MKEPRTTPRRALNRRDLLRFIGGAVAAGCADSLFPGSLAAQAEQVPQRITDLFTSLAENWQEPWIWRPEDWPGELLDLNGWTEAQAGQLPVGTKVKVPIR